MRKSDGGLELGRNLPPKIAGCWRDKTVHTTRTVGTVRGGGVGGLGKGKPRGGIVIKSGNCKRPFFLLFALKKKVQNVVINMHSTGEKAISSVTSQCSIKVTCQ